MVETLASSSIAQPSVTPYRKLFIVGCPRSGTTWLWQMMKLHRDVLSPHYESHVYRLIYDPFTYVPQMPAQKRFEQKVWFFKHYGLLPTLLGVSERSMWNGVLRSYSNYARAGTVGPHTLVNSSDFKMLVQRIRQQSGNGVERSKALITSVFDQYFEREGGQPHQLFLEKTPLHIDYVDVILKQFPEAKVAIIARDGRDVCASWQARAKKQKWARQPTTTIIERWNQCVELTQKYQADPEICDRIYLLKYEDLRSQTEQQLQNVFQFSGLNCSDSELQEIIQQQDINRVARKGAGLHVRKGHVGDWKQSLSSEDRDLWKKLAGENLLSLGYSI